MLAKHIYVSGNRNDATKQIEILYRQKTKTSVLYRKRMFSILDDRGDIKHETFRNETRIRQYISVLGTDGTLCPEGLSGVKEKSQRK